MKNFKQPGQRMTVTAPSGGLVGGNLYKVGNFVGVVAYNAAEGEETEVESGGVYTVTKTTGEAWTKGQAIYMTSAFVATTTASGNTKIGIAWNAAASAAGLGDVRLNTDF